MSLNNEKIASLSDVKNAFMDNVLNPALTGAKGSNDIPVFYGSSYYGERGSSVGFKNPPAIPVEDLKDAKKEQESLGQGISLPNAGDIMTGRQIYNALLAVMGRLGNLRKYRSSWFHQVQGAMSLIKTSEGKAVFQDTLSTLPEYKSVSNSPKNGWERSTDAGKVVYNIPELDTTGEMVSANRVSQFFTELYASWEKAYNNEVVYKFYTCHQNCHGNCHGSRGRR